MKEWLETGIHQVAALLREDPDFQGLSQRLDEAKKKYDRATRSLTPDQQQTVEDYIALCEELEYQRTFTAYYCGKRNG